MGGKRKRGGGGKGNANNENQPSKKKAKNGEPAPALAPSSLEDLDKSPFTGEDRKREAHIYNLLGSYDNAEHIAAADALITGLLSSDEDVLQRHLEKRLFRGLASSRNASRVGFSLVLTEILCQLFGAKALSESKFTNLTFDKVLGILLEKTQPSGNLPGQEERDFYFGQLFGLQCFVEAKILFGDDSSRWLTIMDLLLKLANKKVWLRSHCAWVIVQTLPQMGQTKAEETLKKLVDANWGKSAEGVGIWLKAASCYPKMKLPSKPWTNPLAPKSLPELANVLKENVKQDTGNQEAAAANAVASNWNSQLHFVWDLILEFFLGRLDTTKAPDAEHFKLFWGTVIDDGLFSKNATEGQKFRGFMLFQKFLQGLAAAKENDFVKHLFTRNLMKCMINQAAKEDRYVHRAAVKSLKTVVDVVEAEPSLLLPVLTELFGKHGGYDFDQRTHSKTVEKLLQYTTQSEADAIFALLRAPIVSIKDEEEAQVEKLRRLYADYLFKTCTPEKVQLEGTSEDSQSAKGDVLATAIREMAVCAYTKTDGSFKPDLSEKSREYFRNRLESAFARLTKRREDYRYLCDAVASIEPSAVEMSEEIETERKAALKALKKLIKSSSKAGEQEGSLLGLALLYAITILQLYNGDPDALNTLADLKQCSEKIQEADDAASALLIEILLSLVSQPSPMMRQITQQVFEAFTSQFSADALERLTDPLTAEENIKGQQALFSAEDEEMVDADASDDEEGEEDEEDEEDDGDDEDEISEIGSDVEFVTLNGAGQEDEDAEEESDEEEGEGDDAQARELADLDDALAKVLRSHRLDKDQDADSSDNDSDMTDSEMMALDDKLVEVFKQRTKKSNKKKENKDAKETMIIFKHRIMDFLDIYVKKEAHNPLAFDLLLPLLELIRTTSTKDLSNKAMKVISDFSDAFKKGKAKTKTSGTDVDTGARLELLQKVLHEATRDQSHAFARAVSMCALLLATSLATAGEVEGAIDAYTSAMKEFAKGTKYQPTIFSDFTNWLQSCPKP